MPSSTATINSCSALLACGRSLTHEGESGNSDNQLAVVVAEVVAEVVVVASVVVTEVSSEDVVASLVCVAVISVAAVVSVVVVVTFQEYNHVSVLLDGSGVSKV